MKRLLFAIALICCLYSPMQPLQAQSAAKPAVQTTIPEERQILVLLRPLPARYRADSAYGGAYGDGGQRAARERRGRSIARKHKIEFVDVWPMPALKLDCFIVAAPDAQSAQALAEEIARDEEVEWAQPVQRYEVLEMPAAYNDPLFPVAPVARQWQLTELHRLATGKGVTVAVIDTQVDARHPDLAGQLATEQDFVLGRPSGAEQHGTAVAGVIAAKANNRLGMVGVAPQARLLALRACWQLADARVAVCDSLTLAKALHFAIERDAHVVNMSLSGPPDRLLTALIDSGLARGMTIVASVDPKVADGGFPASHTGVIAVADATTGGAPEGAVLAPGSGIPTTQPGAKWNLVSGSSFAAAHVTGLAALMRERRKDAVYGPDAFISMAGKDPAIDAQASLIRAGNGCRRGCSHLRPMGR